MLAVKFKYDLKRIQLWFIKLVLLFNVFAFSGYHGNLPLASPTSIHTELVFSAKDIPTYKVKYSAKALNKSVDHPFLSAIKLNHHWSLLSFNNSIAVQYHSISRNTFSYSCAYISLPIKAFLSSSDDENPNLLVG